MTQIASAAARSRTISANGLSLRRFRSRKRRTAASLRASQARWNPPSPLIARISPAASRRRASPAVGRKRRTAHRAGIRLRVKPPVGRVVILPLALRAHPEDRHRRLRPVVRNVLNDRVSRTAIGAVRERVAEAPVGRIHRIGQAGVAGRDIRRDQGELAGLGHAVPDREARLAGRLHLRDRALLDPGERRRLRPQSPRRTSSTAGGRSFRLRHQPSRGIEHVPGEPQFARQVINERSESDSLDDAAQPDLHAPPGSRIGHQRCTRPEPPPFSSDLTSSTVTRLKSPGIECFRQLDATANSSASWCVGSIR